MEKISIKEGIKFHGHLGPYLILGLLAGEYALNKLKCKRYFGLDVKVWGANKKPKSCLIDGLQLSTGATYGKGNIRKYNGKVIKIGIRKTDDKRKIGILLRRALLKELDSTKTHKDSENLAKRLYTTKPGKIFLMRS